VHPFIKSNGLKFKFNICKNHASKVKTLGGVKRVEMGEWRVEMGERRGASDSVIF